MQLNRRTTGNRRFRERATTVLASAGALAMTTGFLLMAATGPAGADSGPKNGDVRGDSVGICHSTGQPDKWVYQGPNDSGVVHGHFGDHHHEGRDVIPAFTYDVFEDGHWVEKHFPGQNLDKVDTIGDDGCQVPLIEVSPVPYTAQPATCDADGVLEPQVQPAGVTAEQHPSGTGPGTYEIEFEAEDGYTLVGKKNQPITVDKQKTGPDCAAPGTPTPVMPAEGSIRAADCAVPGSLVVPGQQTGVRVQQDPAGTAPGTYTLTYTLESADYVWRDGHVGPRTQSLVVPSAKLEQSSDPSGDCYRAPDKGGPGGTPTDKPSPTEEPSPTVPTPTVPTPSVPTPTAPGENPGGDGGQQPAADKCRNIAGIQHTVPEGLVVKGDGFCAKPTEVKGTETSAPHPDQSHPDHSGPDQNGPDQKGPNRPGPAIKGVVGVPTAFPAGVPGMAAADTAAVGTAPAGTKAGAPALLAQLLVAGGLLLMLAAGGLRLGRPARGVHEV